MLVSDCLEFEVHTRTYLCHSRSFAPLHRRPEAEPTCSCSDRQKSPRTVPRRPRERRSLRSRPVGCADCAEHGRRARPRPACVARQRSMGIIVEREQKSSLPVYHRAISALRWSTTSIGALCPLALGWRRPGSNFATVMEISRHFDGPSLLGTTSTSGDGGGCRLYLTASKATMSKLLRRCYLQIIRFVIVIVIFRRLIGVHIISRVKVAITLIVEGC